MKSATTHCGYCGECGKLWYPSRKIAKAAVRKLNGHRGLAAYACPAHDHYWHVGHLPKSIKRGSVGRDVLQRRS